MSMQDYNSALQLLEGADGRHFVGPRPEPVVSKAEVALGIPFPPSYRRFLLELGCGGIGGLEIYGVIDDDFEESEIPDGIWWTLTLRDQINLDPAYVVISDGGDGSLYALDSRKVDQDGECPVVLLSVGGGHQQQAAPCFGSFLLERVTFYLGAYTRH